MPGTISCHSAGWLSRKRQVTIPSLSIEQTPNRTRETKVLVYADSAVFSGAESLLCELVESLHEDQRFSFAVATPEVNQELSARLGVVAGPGDRFQVPAQKLPLAALHLYSPRALKAARNVLRRSEPDVVLLNLPSAEYGSTLLLAGHSPGVPVVGLMHISGTMAELGFRLGSVRTALARRAISRLDRVLLLSEAARRSYPARWNSRSTATDVIRMPEPKVSLTDKSAARKELGLPDGKLVIGTVGRISVKQKGQDTFVSAARRLAAIRDDLAFAVVGEGRDKDLVRKLVAEAGLQESFFLTGQVSDVGIALSAIDLIAIPSRFEGLPLIALEALAAGVPGVASSVDGLCDIWPVEWRVDPDDPEGLAFSLARLLEASDDERERLIESGREMMKNRTASDAASRIATNLELAAPYVHR